MAYSNKGFYEKGDAKNLTEFDVPEDMKNATNTSAYVSDLEWEMKGVYVGLVFEL